MPTVTEELRQEAITELEVLASHIQDTRYALLYKTLSPETIDDELKNTFQDLFNITQKLRAVNGEEWPYPQSSQYRNYNPRYFPRRASHHPTDYLNDLPHPPEDYETK